MFIGLIVDVIDVMGLKDVVKVLMVKVGVLIVFGYYGEVQDVEILLVEVVKIGYFVLIKVCVGGGGKGMWLVENVVDFLEVLVVVQCEGQVSFGDLVCLIEKYIIQLCYIEIQVFGDVYGNVVYMFEWDCLL